MDAIDVKLREAALRVSDDFHLDDGDGPYLDEPAIDVLCATLDKALGYRELVEAMRAYLSVDGSNGTYDAMGLVSARKRLRAVLPAEPGEEREG